MSEVFVSYKREDLAAVGRLVEALRAEGIGVWWDQDIPPNAAWEATIERQLAVAKLVIVAWSPAAVASDNVKAEARWARQQGRLLQVFVEACEPPLFFGERQGVDLKHWAGVASDPAFRTALAAVRDGLESRPVPVPEADASPPAPLPLPTKPSIAVMPFANLSSDPEQDYFADGMVEEITRALSRYKTIFVIGAESGLSFKGKATTAQEAAQALGVRYVLEGSVRKAGGRVRIAVKLIDAADGSQIWADRFEDTLEDVFALQDTVALAVAGVAQPAVSEAEIRRASSRPTENMGSYDLCLRAWALYRSVAKADVEAALALLERAIALDPENGSALATAVICHSLILVNGWSDDPTPHLAETQALAPRALRAAGDDPDVLINLALSITMLGGDLEDALALADRAMEINPGSSVVWYASGWVRVQLGEPQRAYEDLETALRLDPFSPYRSLMLCGMGVARFGQGRFREAVSLLKQSVQLQPAFGMAYMFLAAGQGQLGEIGAAQDALARFKSLSATANTGAATWPELAARKLLVEGIALVEGGSLAENSAAD